MTNRPRIDEVRKILVDSFMAGDITTYTNAVLEMERLIGVSHGHRHGAVPAVVLPKTVSHRVHGAEVTEHILAMRRNGMTPTEISRETGIPRRTVSNKFKAAIGRRSIEAETIDGAVTWSVKYPKD